MTTSVGFWGTVLVGSALVFACEGSPGKLAQMSDAGADSGEPVGGERGADLPGYGGSQAGAGDVDPAVNGGDAPGGAPAATGSSNSGSGVEGSIVVSSSATQGVFSYKTDVHFGPAGSTEGCQVRVEGACKVTDCAPGDSPDTYPHVGTISISGGSKALSLVPNASGVYPEATGSGIYWSPGVSVRFSAVGGTLPAFPETELTPPEVVTDVLVNGVAAPVYPAKLTLSRTQPLEISWMGGTDAIGFVLGQISGLNVHVVTCDTTTDAQGFTIPETLLTELTTSTQASLQFVQTAIKPVAAGEASVALGLATHPNPGVVVVNVE